MGVDFRVFYKDRKVVKIGGVYVFMERYYLGCGLVLQVYRGCKDKGKKIFICSFGEGDRV